MIGEQVLSFLPLCGEQNFMEMWPCFNFGGKSWEREGKKEFRPARSKEQPATVLGTIGMSTQRHVEYLCAICVCTYVSGKSESQNWTRLAFSRPKEASSLMSKLGKHCESILSRCIVVNVRRRYCGFTRALLLPCQPVDTSSRHGWI